MSDATWRNRFGKIKFGSIIFDDGTVTPLDWRDLMWIARAVRGEAGLYGSANEEASAIMWTMTNRLRIVKDIPIGRGAAAHNPPHRLFHVFLSYCAPINPYQRDRGDARTQARRAIYATMGPDKVDHGQADPGINPASLPHIVKFMRGGISRAPYLQYVDFAACDCEGCGRDTHGPEDMRLDDCFWIGPGGRTLNERSVVIVPPTSRHVGGVAAGAVLTLGAGGLLYAVR